MPKADILDPSPLDEAIWALYVSGAVPREYQRTLGRSVGALFPQRLLALYTRRWRGTHPGYASRSRPRKCPDRKYHLGEDPEAKRERLRLYYVAYDLARSEARKALYAARKVTP